MRWTCPACRQPVHTSNQRLDQHTARDGATCRLSGVSMSVAFEEHLDGLDRVVNGS